MTARCALHMGALKIFESPTATFPEIFNGFVPIEPMNVRTKFEVRSFTHSWDNSNWSFGWGLPTFNLGKGERRGREWYRSKQRWWLHSSYGPSIVTFPLYLRISVILPLLCSSTPLFHTTTLVSPKSPHVPLGIGGWPLGYQERRCLANCLCN